MSSFLKIFFLFLILFAIYSDKANQFFWFSFLIVILTYFLLYELLDFLEKRQSNIVIINDVEGNFYEMIKNNKKNPQDEIKNEVEKKIK